MKQYTIKRITTADVKALQAVSRETFKATFAAFTAPDEMARFLKEDYATAKLTKEINNRDSRFFFLMVKDKVAGYLKVNVGKAQTEHLRPNSFELERIYLRRQYQGQGLGVVLLKYAEKLARQGNYDYLWLGVYEKNYRAQKFYAADGFKRVGQHTFQVGSDPQTDYLLLKKLR